MSNLANNINNNKALNVNALANGQNLILNSTLNVNGSYSPITYMGITNINNQFAVYMNFTNPSSNININAAQIAGTVTPGDTVDFTVHNASLSGGSVTVSHTVASGDTLTSIATNIANLINSNTSLNALGVSATSTNATILLNSQSINKTTYAASGIVSGTNTITESMFIWQNNNATQSIVINGTVTAGNYVYVTTYNNLLSGNPGQEIVNYRVSKGQTLAQVASGLANAINSDSNLQAINVTAIAINNIVYITSNGELATTYNAYTSSGSSITAIIPGNINARNYAYNNVNEITTIGQTPINVSLKGRSNTAVTSTNTVTPNSSSNPGIFTTNQEFTVNAPLSQGSKSMGSFITYAYKLTPPCSPIGSRVSQRPMLGL